MFCVNYNIKKKKQFKESVTFSNRTKKIHSVEINNYNGI